MKEELTHAEDSDMEEGSEPGTVYELGYLIVPLVSEENVAAEATRLKELIENNKGTVIADEWPKMRPLAYPMKKVVEGMRHNFETGYFSWIKFEAPPESIAILNEEITAIENVLRYLIIKTVRENPVREKRADLSKIGKESEEEGAVEEKAAPAEAGIVAEELDKTIEELVVE